MDDHNPTGPYKTTQRSGLLLGGALFLVLLLLPAPAGLSIAAWRTTALTLLMAIWWMTEAIPIPATSLLPLVLVPTLGVLSMADTAAPYANELIFLFMGGFFLAAAMQSSGLHRRVALRIVAAVGTGPRQLVLGFMLATAFLSMWISNTATTVMMLPIGLAVGELLRPDDQKGPYPFGIALMLGIAYGATIGGVTTLIGTPPNAVLAGAASELLGIELGFVQWMMVGLPFALILLPAAWLLLVMLHPPGEIAGNARDVLGEQLAALGAPSRFEKVVVTVFSLTAAAWILRAPKQFGDVSIPGIQTYLPAVRDSTIAMAATLVLFLTPIDWRKGVFALDWERARRIPWGVLILFGGGLSLARAIDQSGLAAWIGGAVASLGDVPTWVVVAVVAGLFVFLTEITSNTATTTIAMPIMAAAAVALPLDPLSLMTVAALACSMAFMLPVATPPNAIVFGSGYITIHQMVRAGILLNLLAIVLITLLAPILLPVLTR